MDWRPLLFLRPVVAGFCSENRGGHLSNLSRGSSMFLSNWESHQWCLLISYASRTSSRQMISNQVENCYARVKPGETKQINSKSLEDAQAGVNFGTLSNSMSTTMWTPCHLDALWVLRDADRLEIRKMDWLTGVGARVVDCPTQL